MFSNGMPHGNLIERNVSVQRLTAKDAAAHYGVSVTTIYRRARAGRIIASKNARGHWEILDNGTTLEIAEMAAQMRDRLAVRNALDVAPVHTCQSYDPNEFYTLRLRTRSNIAVPSSRIRRAVMSI